MGYLFIVFSSVQFLEMGALKIRFEGFANFRRSFIEIHNLFLSSQLFYLLETLPFATTLISTGHLLTTTKCHCVEIVIIISGKDVICLNRQLFFVSEEYYLLLFFKIMFLSL